LCCRHPNICILILKDCFPAVGITEIALRAFVLIPGVGSIDFLQPQSPTIRMRPESASKSAATRTTVEDASPFERVAPDAPCDCEIINEPLGVPCEWIVRTRRRDSAVVIASDAGGIVFADPEARPGKSEGSEQSCRKEEEEFFHAGRYLLIAWRSWRSVRIECVKADLVLLPAIHGETVQARRGAGVECKYYGAI
jgi:hypothetical protein